MDLTNIVATFFFVANPIGNAPAIISIIKNFDFERQKKIMIRESILALLFALCFQYLGHSFLSQLEIKEFSVSICGGVLLLIVALNMIFSSHEDEGKKEMTQEPFFVPIATPLISGPGLLTAVMVYTYQEEDNLKITLAICLTWVLVSAILIASPYLQKILRKRGLAALEQLMGLILSMMSVEMIVQGIRAFVKVV